MRTMKHLAMAVMTATALALAGCGGGGSSGPSAAQDAARQAEEARQAQISAAEMAVMAASEAVDALDGASNDEAIENAQGLIDMAQDAIGELDAADQGDLSTELATVQDRHDKAEAFAALTEEQQQAEEERRMAEQEAAREAMAAMAATAAKLYAGIAAQNGTAATVAAGTALSAGERAAAYNDDGTPTGATVDTRIMVGIGTDTPVALSEDKKTMVADNHGWAGKRYMAEPDDDGMYEAMVYSNVGDPMEGDMFGQVGVTTPADGYEYGLNEGGELTTIAPANVASSSFDQSAGTKEFELPTNTVRVMIPGSYHGVSGTYYCTPASSSTCAAQVAADGFTLGGTADADNAFTTGGGTWTFKPGNPDDRVTSMPDAIYASYGWWLHKSEDGSMFTASAFADVKGAVPAAAALDTLQGTATYMGGAAGKYALSSSTGGTNDAGHFTARATLNADFSDNSITGMIDNFMGADGMDRNWSVELKKAALATTGGITRTGAGESDNDTVWTMGGTAASASGEWSGMLYDNGADGVPKVGTGTFHSTFNGDGQMVGAFGVNKE